LDEEQRREMLAIVKNMRDVLEAAPASLLGDSTGILELLDDVDRALVAGAGGAAALERAIEEITSTLSVPPFGATRGATALVDGLSDPRVDLPRLWNEFVEVHVPENPDDWAPRDPVES
jgi:hypothetical protein